jgi:hypothetical protein
MIATDAWLRKLAARRSARRFGGGYLLGKGYLPKILNR